MGANGRLPETVLGTIVAQSTLSYAALLTAELPEARPLVEGLIEEESGNILAGPPSVGKTWLALALARAVASGGKWLGHFPTNQATVLVVDEESHLPGLQARARMLEAGDPMGPDLPLFFAIGHGVRLDVNPGAAHLDGLLAAHKPGLTILDSLTRVHGADENSAGQMADVFANAKALMRAHGTALLFTDHIRKKSLLNDPEEMLRGSTEKRAWPECILFATPGERGTLTVTHVKARFTERLPDFAVTVAVDKAVGAATVTHAGAAPSQGEAKANDLLQAIHALKAQLGDDGADATTVAGWLDVHPDTVRRHAKRLVAAGILATRKASTGGAPKDVYDAIGGRD
ncbi:MAG: AAA family ATPase [Chloroflexota bacterium]|nr:AAA family ATPase [Chloroflexota bacterium]